MSEFTELLNDEYKSNEFLGKIQDANQAAKMLLDGQSYAGQSVKLPADGDSEETRAKMLAKIGKHFPEFARVENAEDYGSNLTYKSGDAEYTYDGADFQAFRETAYQAGLTKKQFESMAEAMHTRNRTNDADKLHLLSKGWRDLMVEEGVEFTKTTQALKQFIVAQDMPTEWVDAVASQTLDPTWAKVLIRLSAQFQEGKALPGQSSDAATQNPGTSKDQARARIIEIDRTPNWPHNPELRNERMKLIAIINDETLKGGIF